MGTGSRGPIQVRQFTSPLHVNKFSGMSVVVMTCVEHESRCQVSVWPTYDDSQVGWWQVGRRRGGWGQAHADQRKSVNSHRPSM